MSALGGDVWRGVAGDADTGGAGAATRSSTVPILTVGASATNAAVEGSVGAGTCSGRGSGPASGVADKGASAAGLGSETASPPTQARASRKDGPRWRGRVGCSTGGRVSEGGADGEGDGDGAVRDVGASGEAGALTSIVEVVKGVASGAAVGRGMSRGAATPWGRGLIGSITGEAGADFSRDSDSEGGETSSAGRSRWSTDGERVVASTRDVGAGASSAIWGVAFGKRAGAADGCGSGLAREASGSAAKAEIRPSDDCAAAGRSSSGGNRRRELGASTKDAA